MIFTVEQYEIETKQKQTPAKCICMVHPDKATKTSME